MRTVATLVVLFIALLLLLRLFENRLVFYPFKYPQGTWHPEWFGLQVEDCTFTAPDGANLHGWFVKNDSALATLLWCHGNAGNITDRLDNLRQLAKLPLQIFIFDYRGYGKSEGSPHEAGVYLDAEAAYDYLISRDEVTKDRMIIFGRSLGGAVAVDLATKRACAGLILESTFTHAKDMARVAFPGLPVKYIMKSRFDSVSKIKQIEAPVFFIHGTADRTVPFELGRQLYAAANQPKAFWQIEGADHNDTYLVAGREYFDRLFEFVQTTCFENR
ncbi:MAG: alpha/beta hydrolase [bacterium]